MEGGFVFSRGVESDGRLVAVLPRGVAVPLVGARRSVGGYDGGECCAGGDEEGFHGESELAEGVESEIGAVDYGSALEGVY